MDGAAESRHLNMTKRLHENRSEECAPLAMQLVPDNGHFDVLLFSHANRSEGCARGAIRYVQTYMEDLEMVQRLYEKYPEAADVNFFRSNIQDPYPRVRLPARAFVRYLPAVWGRRARRRSSVAKESNTRRRRSQMSESSMVPRRRHHRAANDPNATLLEALMEAGENVWRKLHLFAIGLLHLLFSSDKQWLNQLQQCERDLTTTNEEKEEEEGLLGSTTSDDQMQMQMQIPQQRKVKRIIFVRHAESEWNVVFNRGVHWRAIMYFVRACVREWLMLPTQHSIFIDSPLSRRGVRQAKELFDDVSNGQIQDLECGGNGTAKSAEKAAVLRYLSCPLPDSIIVTSNLRRAIDTARIASAARLELPNEKIHVLSSLQEIGRNIDTLTISDAYAIKPQVLSSALRIEKGREDLFNLKESHGNKAVLGCGRTRLEAFAKWAMGQDEDVLVVYGHSLWFRAFCREYFPSGVDNDAKRNKLANCGVVSFAFEERSVAVKSASATAPELFGPHMRKEYQIIPESFLFVR